MSARKIWVIPAPDKDIRGQAPVEIQMPYQARHDILCVSYQSLR